MSLFLNFLIEGWCQIINTRSEAFETKAFDTRNKASNTRSKASEKPEAKLLKIEFCAYRIGFDNLEKVKVKFLSANGRCVFY